MSSYRWSSHPPLWGITTDMYPGSIDLNAGGHADAEKFSSRGDEKRSPAGKGGGGSTANSTLTGHSAGAVVGGIGTAAPFAIVFSLLVTLGMLVI